MVLEKVHLISLKTILQSKIFIALIICVTSGYTYYVINNNIYHSEYNVSDNEVCGIVSNIKISGNHVSLYVNDILINYYAEKEADLNNITLGDNICATGTLNVPPDNTNFNLFNYRYYLLSQNIHYVMKDTTIESVISNDNIFYNIKKWIQKRIDKIDSSGYLNTFILGDKNDLDEIVVQSYQNNGISHLFAVSGMHVTLLSSILLFILNRINKKETINYFIVILFLLLYLFLTNYSPSIIRASGIFIILTINKVFKLGVKTVNIFILFTCTILITNPYNIYNNGFVFSYVISFYLILFGKITGNYKNYFVNVLIISLISFLVSIPVMINSFFSINLLSFLINIVFVPLVSVIIFPLSLLTFFIPIFSYLLNITIYIMEELSLIISNIKIFNIVLCNVPWYVIIIYYVIITFVIHKISIKEYKYIVVLILILIFHSKIVYFRGYTLITMLDVGQGDSIFLSFPNNKGNILIDTGGITSYETEPWKQKKKFSYATSTIIPYLKSVGIDHLDYLIITHGDSDHIGDATDIILNYKVDNVIMNSGYNNYNEKSLIDILNKKSIKYQFFSTNDLRINEYVLHFINDIDKHNENEDSLIIYTEINNHNILLMGDAGEESEEYILNEYNLGSVDILKVGHHGSKYSTSKNFIDTIKPNYALISVGLNNKFNHPSPITLENLQETNAYLTSINGAIEIKIDHEILVKSVR